MKLSTSVGFALVALALFAAPPAKANSYSFDFTSSPGSGPAYNIDGSITTGSALGNGYFEITGISGTIIGPSGISSITGLAESLYATPPSYLTSSNGLWYFDNAFNPATPYIAYGGPYFTSSTGALYDLYFSSGLTYLSTNDPNGVYNPGVVGDLSVTQTPLPATWSMLVGGLLALGIFVQRQRKSDPSLSAAA
jgi:hypothetical protein